METQTEQADRETQEILTYNRNTKEEEAARKVNEKFKGTAAELKKLEKGKPISPTFLGFFALDEQLRKFGARCAYPSDLEARLFRNGEYDSEYWFEQAEKARVPIQSAIIIYGWGNYNQEIVNEDLALRLLSQIPKGKLPEFPIVFTGLKTVKADTEYRLAFDLTEYSNYWHEPILKKPGDDSMVYKHTIDRRILQKYFDPRDKRLIETGFPNEDIFSKKFERKESDIELTLKEKIQNALNSLNSPIARKIIFPCSGLYGFYRDNKILPPLTLHGEWPHLNLNFSHYVIIVK